MGNTFKYTVLSIVREPSIIFWAMIFPIILSTLFNVMFTGLEEAAYRLQAVPVAVVSDAQGMAGESFDQMMDTLSEGDDALLSPMDAETHDEAMDLLADGSVVGIISVDAEGWPSLELSPTTGDVGASMDSIERTVLADVVNNYVRTRMLVQGIASSNPMALMNPDVTDSFMSAADYTREISVTHSRAVESVRYFYALLGFAALMVAQIGLTVVGRTLPNVSPLGARRAVSGTSRARTLVGSLAASWTLSFAVLLVAFGYIRFILGIDFGGRDAVCVLGLAVASLMSTALGALIGALPSIPEGAKGGILTGITCFLSLFAGLYGTPAMNLADQVARDLPWAAAVNPAKQVTDLFYSLYVYPDLQPFFQSAGVLLIMSAVFALVAALFMRRQSYARL